MTELADKITTWRSAAVMYVKTAQDALAATEGLNDVDRGKAHIDMAMAASMATMYLALAQDAERFGELPPPLVSE